MRGGLFLKHFLWHQSKRGSLYFTTSVHIFVLGYSKRDKFIPNYFQLLTIYEIIYMRLFSVYKYVICVLVDVCCEKGVHIFLVSKS